MKVSLKTKKNSVRLISKTIQNQHDFLLPYNQFNFLNLNFTSLLQYA